MYLSGIKEGYIRPLVELESNKCENLIDYSVKNLFPDIFKGLSATYLEFPFKTKLVLGHTMKDQLGLSVMINKNINDESRKLFTQAHELGHIVMHQGFLNGSSLDFENDIDEANSDMREHEANLFAANLILPVQVAYTHVMEKHTAKQIRFFTGLSVQSTLFRLKNILKKVYWFQDENLIEQIVKQYSTCNHMDEVGSSELYKIFSEGYKLPHIDSPNARSFVNDNSDLSKKLAQNIKLEKNALNIEINNFNNIQRIIGSL